MDWPLDTASTGALGTSLTLFAGAIAALMKARAKTNEAHAARVEASAKARLIDAEREKTGVHALAEAREDLAERLDRVESEHKAERAEWLAKFERQDRRLDVQEAALGDARSETTRIRWELDNAQSELRTTREYVEQLQAQNAKQGEQLAAQDSQIRGLKARVLELERELAASEGRAQKLADELHDKKRAMGAGYMSASPLTPIPPAPRVPKR